MLELTGESGDKIWIVAAYVEYVEVSANYTAVGFTSGATARVQEDMRTVVMTLQPLLARGK